MKWLRELWREVVAEWNRPPDWADYAATKDWDMAEMLWREERAKANDAAVRAITARSRADLDGSQA